MARNYCIIEVMAKNHGHDHELDYDDILISNGGGNNNKKQLPKAAKFGVIAIGLMLIIMLASFAYSLIFSAPDNAQQLVSTAKQQGKIIQAAELGVKGARSQEARNLAITTQLSLEGDQPILLNALKAQNVRVSVGDDPEVEQLLVSADQSNRLDEVLIEFLRLELNKYINSLNASFRTTTDPDLKEVLEQQYRNAEFLVTPLNERAKLEQ